MRWRDIRIQNVRAYSLRGPGSDYHDRGEEFHWIDDHIASPMAKYPEYRRSRRAWGIDALGSLIVEVEASSGEVGFGVGTGGIPGSWIVENHLARFVEGSSVYEIERIWDQMYRSSLHYGRKGLVMNVISAVDLAIWDLLGKLRGEPVWQLLGGPVRDELAFYATGPRPDLAQELGFIGGKLPLLHGPAEGEEGLRKNLALAAEMRNRVGDDFWLMYDCWMSLDVHYALRLMEGLEQYGFKWLEECLPPDDYWGYAELKRRKPASMLITTGEHEYGLMGFRMLLDMECCDVIQPDVGWCGGMTELIKISALAEAHNVLVIPHASSVYGYHFVVTRHHSPFTEFLMLAPEADRVVPTFSPLLIGEPIPENGRLTLSKSPGFGVELNRDVGLERPFTH